ncbi:patatin-like phospholipase domain-containing protein 4 [Ptychodera flava]|uniref:patatin-like phospholipase domain-containing protein 4 n=1 Tax=Ptychodera flava TaxID=63121 RepID=UPI00396A1151
MSEEHKKVNLAFGGGIFLGTYQLGVAKCLHAHGKALLDLVECYGGVSSGVIAAALLVVCPDKIGEYIAKVKDLSDKLRTKGGISPELRPGLNDRLRSILQSIIPEDAHQKASGKLVISAMPFRKKKHDYTIPVYWGDGQSWMRYGLSKGTTALDIFKKLVEFPTDKIHVIKEFSDKDHLIDAIIGATYIPLWGGEKFIEFNGNCWMDAGFIDNMPRVEGFGNDHRAVRVSPFMGENLAVCPTRNVNGMERHTSFFSGQPLDWSIWNLTRAKDALYPPSGDTLHDYFEDGFHDGEKFLRRLK